ncbi:hypothetical protein J6590_055359 [Homalodisca vitripennis]|nr:hypothetical protein J6590_055359 [Homalodisca vitripennis]
MKTAFVYVTRTKTGCVYTAREPVGHTAAGHIVAHGNRGIETRESFMKPRRCSNPLLKRCFDANSGATERSKLWSGELQLGVDTSPAVTFQSVMRTRMEGNASICLILSSLKLIDWQFRKLTNRVFIVKSTN